MRIDISNGRTAVALSALVVACSVTGPEFAAAQAQSLPLRLEATAVNMSNIGRTGMTTLDIVIDRWSTDADRVRLRTMLEEGEEDTVRGALQELKPVGHIRGTGRLGWDLRFAQQTVLSDGTRRIVFATDRPLSFRESLAGGVIRDYDVMVGEVRLDAKGEGRGTFVPWARVDYDGRTNEFVVENFASQPVRLTRVRARGEH